MPTPYRVAAMVLTIAMLSVVPAQPVSTTARAPRWPSCGTWIKVDTPDAPFLDDVAVVSPYLAWATGGDESPMILRWDGWRWTALPFARQRYGALGALAIVSEAEAWAVGSLSGLPAAARWNGEHWGLMPLPVSGDGYLSGIVGVPGTRRMWAVGTLDRNETHPLVLRWDGRAWHRVFLPAAWASIRPYDVALGHHSVVIVGDMWFEKQRTHRLVFAWRHAGRWHRHVGQPGRLVAATTGFDGRVWAVGTKMRGRLRERGTILRWDGLDVRTVRTVTAPSSFSDVTAVGPRDVWAGGTRGDEPLLVRRHFGTWRRADAPDAAINAIDGTPHDLWIVANAWGDPDAPALAGSTTSFHRC